MQPGYESQDEYSVLDYLSIARKRWIHVLVPVVIFTALAVAWTITRPPVYQASARVYTGPTTVQAELEGRSQNTGFLSRELSNEISFAFSDPVETLVEAELGELPEIRITAANEGDVLEFRANADTPETAANNANVWAEKYIEAKRDEAVSSIAAAIESLETRLEQLRSTRQELREPLQVLDDRINSAITPEQASEFQRDYDRLLDDLQYDLDVITTEAEGVTARLSALRLETQLASVGEARVEQRAAPPLSSTNAPLSRNVPLGLILGLLAGFALALLAETRDNTIASASDVQGITDVPVLASIPVAKKKDEPNLALSTLRDPEGIYANAYHKVRSSIEFLSLDGDIRSVLITSAGASEGKTTSSSNIALAFSLVGKRTVLADVDFRRSRVHEVFAIEQSPGLSDIVIDRVPVNQVGRTMADPGLGSLVVVPAGTAPPSPAAFVGTEGFQSVLHWLREQADIVILDGPPTLVVPDPHTMAGQVDGVVLAVRVGATTRRELKETIDALRTSGAKMLGLIVVGVDESETYGRYGDRADPGSRRNGDTAKNDLWSNRPIFSDQKEATKASV